MERLIFLDIDGTLSDINGMVPKSAIEAIQTAKGNGHKIFLCTGRSKGEIYDRILEIGFDGLVCAAGAYVECDNKVLFHKCMEESIVKQLINYLKENRTAFILETNSGVVIEKENLEVLKKLFKDSGVGKNSEIEAYLGVIRTVENAIEVCSVNKVLFFNSCKSLECMQDKFKEYFIVLPNSIGVFGEASGEISDKNINKSIGMQIVLDYYGKTKNDVIAIGDGPNDAEMLKFAQLGIAMGNASKELKQLADEVTDKVNENGIYNSFLKHELI